MQQYNIKENKRELILIPKAEKYIQYIRLLLKMRCRRF